MEAIKPLKSSRKSNERLNEWTKDEDDDDGGGENVRQLWSKVIIMHENGIKYYEYWIVFEGFNLLTTAALGYISLMGGPYSAPNTAAKRGEGRVIDLKDGYKIDLLICESWFFNQAAQ